MNKFTYEQVTEICVGSLLAPDGKQILFNPEDLCPPYRQAVLDFFSDPVRPLSHFLPPQNYARALKMYQSVEELIRPEDGGGIDFGELLAQRAREAKIVLALREAISAWEGGADLDVDPASIVGDTSIASIRPLSSVPPLEHPYMPTGYDPIDRTIGGIPYTGVTAVFGRTGVGKTTFALTLSLQLLQKYPEKTVLYVSMEHIAEALKYQVEQLWGKHYHQLSTLLERLLVVDSLRSGIRYLTSLVMYLDSMATLPGMLVIDDIPGIVGEYDVAKFSVVWAALQEMSRRYRIPIVALAQPNRAAALSRPFPDLHDIAWTGVAENIARLVLGLSLTGEQDIEGQESKWPLHPDGNRHHYLLCLKATYGVHPQDPLDKDKAYKPPFALMFEGDYVNSPYAPWLWPVYGETVLLPASAKKKNGNGKNKGLQIL